MKPIPITKETPVVRTDFSDDDVWSQVCDAIAKPAPFDTGMQFQANVSFIDDADFESLAVDEIVSRMPADFHAVVFVVDAETVSGAGHPVLCIDLLEEPGRSFRFIPSEAWGVENNLSLANMDFDEFMELSDADGVFRGLENG